MDGPVCLIENTKEGTLVVNEEAVNILKGIRQPVVVVSIVGLYRTGKSYLMNKLAGAKKGFNLGYNVQAETKGIWMWCVPHPKKANHMLVLLDTEGLGDVEKGDKKNDLWIFCLAVLLSSALVYNSKGTIDQDAVDKLKFVGDIAELIKVKAQDNEDEEADFSRHFPIFIWAVRDFHLNLNVDGKKITEDDYLENALKPRERVKTSKDLEYNSLRERLHMFFSKRKCFVFDLPSAKTEDLQNMDNISDSDLKSEFVEQTKRFCEYVFKEAQVKTVNSITPVTGSQLGELAKLYTNAIMSSNFACMEDVAHKLSDIENKAAVQEAAQHYEKKMEEIAVFPTDTLNQFLDLSRRCEDEAREIFLKRSFKDDDQKFVQEYMKLVLEKKNKFSNMNEAKSREVCKALIKTFSEDHEEALKNGSYNISGGHKKFKQDLKEIQNKYDVAPGKGIQAKFVLQEYQKSKETIGINILKSDEALTEKDKEIEEEKVKRESKEMEQKVREQKESQKNEKNDDQLKWLEKNLSSMLEKHNEEMKNRNDKLQRDIADKNRERESYEKQGLHKQAKMYQAQVEDIEKEREQLQEPGWYAPIVDTFQNVACAVVPTILELGGKILKSEVIKKWRDYRMPR